MCGPTRPRETQSQTVRRPPNQGWPCRHGGGGPGVPHTVVRPTDSTPRCTPRRTGDGVLNSDLHTRVHSGLFLQSRGGNGLCICQQMTDEHGWSVHPTEHGSALKRKGAVTCSDVQVTVRTSHTVARASSSTYQRPLGESHPLRQEVDGGCRGWGAGVCI